MSDSQNLRQRKLMALENQLARLQRRQARLRRISNRYSWVRLAIFLAGIALVIGAFYLGGFWLALAATVLALAVFFTAAYYHGKVENSLTRHQVWHNLKSAQLARMRLDWDNIPPSPVAELPVPADHPFGIDLDLAGERSILRLLDTAVSREGSLRLREWLLNPRPELPAIRQRQALVRELVPLSHFRDRLTLTAKISSRDLKEQWEGKRLLAWLKAKPAAASLRGDLRLLSGLALLNFALFGLNRLGLIPGLWVFTLLLYVVLSYYKMQKIGDLFENAWTLKDGLEKLGGVLRYLENYRYASRTELKKLCRPLLAGKQRPSAELKRVSRVVNGATLQKNAILWIIINALVPWDFYFAHRLNRLRREIGELLPVWLDVWYELEALNSLAAFAHLNPGYTFPEVVEEGAGPAAIEAQSLGHPLIPAEKKVCNDFRLEGPGRMVIITGSNMAGKSSFLRTLGVNLCLAYAGGPVNAASFQGSLFRLFTCIKVSDSVTDGFSYFYAEVRRLKALLQEIEQSGYPVFFLIDEIFRGTNNRERLIGSRSYLRSLAGRNGLGVVSTHDLELVKLAGQVPQITNNHFREEVVDGRMVFDYKLRSGPSPTTNALKIMEMEGLPVDTALG